MRARVESLSPRALAALAAAAVLLFTAVVWFLVVSPKRADASSAAVELVAAEKRLADAEAAVLGPRTAGASTTDILKLTKAMPSSADQAGLVLELTRLARASGLTLEGIAPQEPVVGAGTPSTIPVAVVVNGRYDDIARFVNRVRLLVTVDDGRVAARGRLLSVRSVALVEADTEKYPELDATVELDAYVYDGPVAPVDVPEPVTEEEPATGGSAAAGGGIMTPDARAARERKQKIFVAIGGIVLLGLLALQLPKLMGGSSSAATTTTTSTSTLPGTPATGAPGTPTPGAIQVALVDTDRPLPHSPEKLHSFSGFRVKDPFVQQVVQPEPEPVRTQPVRATKPKVKTPSKDFSAGKNVRAAGVTVISVNGVRHALEPGAKFPVADPVFVLVSVKPGAKTAVVGVPGGKYENGSRTTKLELGKPLVLVNTKTKSTYRLKLVKVGSKR